MMSVFSSEGFQSSDDYFFFKHFGEKCFSTTHPDSSLFYSWTIDPRSHYYLLTFERFITEFYSRPLYIFLMRVIFLVFNQRGVMLFKGSFNYVVAQPTRDIISDRPSEWSSDRRPEKPFEKRPENH